MQIDTPAARNKLPVQREPHWHKVRKGQHLGFRRTESGGNWIARYNDNGKYLFFALKGIAYAWDHQDAFSCALEAAQKWFPQRAQGGQHGATVGDAIDLYVEYLKLHKSEAASKEAEARMKNQLSEQLQRTELTRLRSRAIAQWHHSLVNGMSKATANRLLTMLKSALNHAFCQGMIGSDAEWKRVKRFPNTDRSRQVFLDEKQITRLFEATEGTRFGDLVEVGLLTGCRLGELTRARTKDFDASHCTLSVTGKTGPRDVYLSDAAVSVLKRVTRDRLPESYLLVAESGNPWPKGAQARPLARVVKKARLPRDMTFSVLRHTYISRALVAGVQIQVLAENCGTPVKMIEKFYGKFLPVDRRGQLNKVMLV